MTASERATLLTELYALRAQASAKNKIFCDEHMLREAAFCAFAAQSLSEAIETFENHCNAVRADASRQTSFYDRGTA